MYLWVLDCSRAVKWGCGSVGDVFDEVGPAGVGSVKKGIINYIT